MTAESTAAKKRKSQELSLDEKHVYFSVKSNKWIGRSMDDLNLFLGHFDTEQKAKKAVLDYAKIYGKQNKKGKNII